jgi:hypothetical protein
MRLSSRFNPVGGLADFWNEIRRPTPYRWPILLASVLCSGAIIYSIASESVLVPPERPKVSLISTFAPGRSDAEIMASNRANQIRKERLAAEQARREEEVKAAYRALGRATGLDVDAMERRAAAERAAEEARAKAARGRTAAAGDGSSDPAAER